MTLPRLFQQAVDRHGDRPALSSKRDGAFRAMTYTEFGQRARALSAYLIEIGLGVGERVAILSENRPEWVIADQAIAGAGGVSVPIYPTLIPSQVAYILNDSTAAVAVVSTLAQRDKLLSLGSQLGHLKTILVMEELPEPDPSGRIRSFALALTAGEELLDRHSGELSRRREALRPDDLASIVYTSGTTGEPKGAMLTHGNFTSNCLAAASCFDLGPGDIELSFLPLSHVFERIVNYVALHSGATIAFAESIETLAQNLLEVRPTFLCAVPRVLEKLYQRIQARIETEPPLRREVFYAALEIGEFFHKVMQEEGRVVFPTNTLYHAADRLVFKQIRASLGGRLRFIVSGAAPLSPEIARFFQVAGLPVIEGYGMTESSPIITLNPPERPKIGTVGQALPGVSVRIAPDGEVVAKGPNIMKGYWNNDDATREAIDAEGWLYTGDLGSLDEDGYLTILDRKKELIVLSNGKKVAPQPIENRLTTQALLEQAMLVGEGRNYVTALLVLNQGEASRMAEGLNLSWHSPAELVALGPVQEAIARVIDQENARVAPFEQIKRWKVLARPFSQEEDELTPTLKLKRRVIVEHFRSEIEQLYQGASPERELVKA
jgi:long-chain acyl-CoA synthetase